MLTGKIEGFNDLEIGNKPVKIVNGQYVDTILYSMYPELGLNNYSVYLDGQYYDNIFANKYWVSTTINEKKLWLSDTIHEFNFIKNEYDKYWEMYFLKLKGEVVCNYSSINETAIVTTVLENSKLLENLDVKGRNSNKTNNELVVWKLNSEDRIQTIELSYYNRNELITIKCKEQ